MKKVKVNKKGFMGSILSDFFALLLFLLVIVVIFFLLRLKGGATNKELKASFLGDEPEIDLLNILRTNVNYNGQNFSIGRLISYSVIDESSSIKNAIISNVSYIYEIANLTNAKLIVMNQKQDYYYYTIQRGQFGILYDWQNCEPGIAEVFLPVDSYKDDYIRVVYSECIK